VTGAADPKLDGVLVIKYDRFAIRIGFMYPDMKKRPCGLALHLLVARCAALLV
jgi:hypothetical protein